MICCIEEEKYENGTENWNGLASDRKSFGPEIHQFTKENCRKKTKNVSSVADRNV